MGITPDQISTFFNIYRQKSPLMTQYYLIPSITNLYLPSTTKYQPVTPYTDPVPSSTSWYNWLVISQLNNFSFYNSFDESGLVCLVFSLNVYFAHLTYLTQFWGGKCWNCKNDTSSHPYIIEEWLEWRRSTWRQNRTSVEPTDHSLWSLGIWERLRRRESLLGISLQTNPVRRNITFDFALLWHST